MTTPEILLIVGGSLAVWSLVFILADIASTLSSIAKTLEEGRGTTGGGVEWSVTYERTGDGGRTGNYVLPLGRFDHT